MKVRGRPWLVGAIGAVGVLVLVGGLWLIPACAAAYSGRPERELTRCMAWGGVVIALGVLHLLQARGLWLRQARAEWLGLLLGGGGAAICLSTAYDGLVRENWETTQYALFAGGYAALQLYAFAGRWLTSRSTSPPNGPD